MEHGIHILENGTIDDNGIGQICVLCGRQRIHGNLLAENGIVFIHEEIGQGCIEARGLNGHTIICRIHGTRVFIHEIVAESVIDTIVIKRLCVRVVIDYGLDNRVIYALEIVKNIRICINGGT